MLTKPDGLGKQRVVGTGAATAQLRQDLHDGSTVSAPDDLQIAYHFVIDVRGEECSTVAIRSILSFDTLETFPIMPKAPPAAKR